MAKALGISLVAEGVETVEQFHRLRETGCRIYQGYLFSPPLDIDAFAELLSPEHPGSEPLSRHLPKLPIRDLVDVAMT